MCDLNALGRHFKTLNCSLYCAAIKSGDASSVCSYKCDRERVWIWKCVCVCGSRKAEQLSPESRLSHKLNARLTAVNGTSEKLLLFGCSTLHSTQHPLYPSLCCSLWQPLTHSTTQHLLSSGSSECFGPRVRKSISFMFFCWNFMGDRSSFSFFFLKRERDRETGVGGREVGQMDRAARKNFFWQRCSFLW